MSPTESSHAPVLFIQLCLKRTGWSLKIFLTIFPASLPPESMLCPFQKVATERQKPMGVDVPFLMGDLSQHMERLGTFSEDLG
jgi:hypothetical protein